MSYSFQSYSSSNKSNTLVERIKANQAKNRTEEKISFQRYSSRRMKFPTIEERSKEIQTDAIYEPEKITVMDITSMKLPDVHIPSVVIEKQNDLDIASFIKLTYSRY